MTKHSKKVWILNHYAGSPSMTPGTRHYNFAKYLHDMDYEAVLFASSAQHNSDKNLITDNSPYLTGNYDGERFVFIKTRQYHGNGLSRVLNMLDFYRGVLRNAKRFERPDIIYASSVHPLTCVAGIKLAKRFNVPCVCEIRDLWPESIVEYAKHSKKSPLIMALYRMEKWIYKKADRLVFTMEGGADYIRDKGWGKHIAASKIHHINNGVDLIEFDRDLTENAAEPPEAAPFRLVYAGSMRKANDLGLIIEAVAELLNRSRYLELVLYGDGEDRPSLQDQTMALEISEQVHFKGRIPKQEIPKALQAAHMTILHYKQVDVWKYGGSQNKLFEYLACGRPVLSTIRMGYDIIGKYGAGISAEAFTKEKIADAIGRMMDLSQEEYSTYCKNARSAAKEYDYPVLTMKLKKIFDEVLQK